MPLIAASSFAPGRDLTDALGHLGHALARAGLVHGQSGNVSVRSGEALLVTAAGARLAELSIDDIVRVPHIDNPPARVTSEFALHAAIYARRRDVHAIAHTHSPYATAWSCIAEGLELSLEEARYYGMGRLVKVARHAPAGTHELAELAAAGLGERSAVLLERHGAVVVGANVDEARCVAESLEHQAQVAWLLSAPAGGIRSQDD